MAVHELIASVQGAAALCLQCKASQFPDLDPDPDPGFWVKLCLAPRCLRIYQHQLDGVSSEPLSPSGQENRV